MKFKKIYTILTVIIVLISGLSGCVKDEIISEESIALMDNIYKLERVDYKEVLNLEEDYSFRGQFDDGIIWLPVAVEDCGIVYGTTQRYDNGKVDFISYDLNSKEKYVISSNDERRFIEYLRYNENYIFWVEMRLEEGQYISVLKLLDKKNENIEVIAENNYRYTYNSEIALCDNFVLWQDEKEVNGIVYPIINKYSFDDYEYSVYKENASNPIIYNDSIVYLGPNKDNQSKISVYKNNYDGNNEQSIIEDKQVKYIEGNNDSIVIAYSEDENKKLGVYKDHIFQEILCSEGIEYNFQFPHISDNFIFWESPHQTMIYDRNLEKVLLIDDDYQCAKGVISNNYIITTMTRDTLGNGKKQTGKIAEENGMYLNDIYVKKIMN